MWAWAVRVVKGDAHHATDNGFKARNLSPVACCLEPKESNNMYKTLVPMLLMLSLVFAAASVTFNPTSGNADCNTGTMVWTGAGFANDANLTLKVGGTAIDPNSCATGTDNDDDTIQADGSGDFVCTLAVSTSQPIGTTTHSVVDLDGGAGNVSYDYRYTYCASYGVVDAGEAVIDIVAGLFAGFAGMGNVLGVALIASILLGIIAAFIFKIKILG